MNKILIIMSAYFLGMCGSVYPNSVPVYTDYIPLMTIQCVTVNGETVILSEKSLYAVFKAKDYSLYATCIVSYRPPLRSVEEADGDIRAEIERRIKESEYCAGEVSNEK